MIKLTEHFTVEELTRSEIAVRNGIDNSCPKELLTNLLFLAGTLEQIRNDYYCPLSVSSGYRCPALNKLIGGAPTSAHVKASAVDFTIKYLKVIDVCRHIPQIIKDFDQVIYEFGPSGWVHLGLSDNPRRQLLTAIIEDEKTKYLPGIIEV